jgi:putative transposase
MAKKEGIGRRSNAIALLSGDEDQLRKLVEVCVQEALEGEMTEAIGAGSYERADGRRGYRSGYYTRGMATRVGRIELRVPRDRQGNFSTEIFERYQRSEKALVHAIMEMYVKGVSTRKVRAITEELCGHTVSASTVSRIVGGLDQELDEFFARPLEEEYPYIILDARYERIREGGVVRRQAVLVAIGIDWDGRRAILGVDMANRESTTSWLGFLQRLKERGLLGVEVAVSDDHEGLRRAIARVLPEAVWQRCYVHFLRNAQDYVPRKRDDDCLTELRWLYDRRDHDEAHEHLTAWISKWHSKYPKLCDWAEENIAETFTFYRLPRPHHKHLRSTNMLERLNEELKRRTHVIRIFPNQASCLRLVRALAVETHEEWLEASRYLNMQQLREHRKLRLLNDEAAA